MVLIKIPLGPKEKATDDVEVHKLREDSMKVLATYEIHLPDDKDGYYLRDPKEELRELDAKFPAQAVLKTAKYVVEKKDAVFHYKKLLRFKLEGGSHLVPFMKRQDGYEKGDEDAPFFSERFLYPLLGKEDARTVLAYIHSMVRDVFNIDPYEVEREVYAEMAAEEDAERRRKEVVEKRRAFRIKFCKEHGHPVSRMYEMTDAMRAKLHEAMKAAGIP